MRVLQQPAPAFREGGKRCRWCGVRGVSHRRTGLRGLRGHSHAFQYQRRSHCVRVRERGIRKTDCADSRAAHLPLIEKGIRMTDTDATLETIQLLRTAVLEFF